MKKLATWLTAASIVQTSFVSLASGSPAKLPNDGVTQHRDDGVQPQDEACVKACEFDLSPCDPWLYKKADGRCNG